MSSWAEVVEPSTRALVDDDSEEENSENQLVEELSRAELFWREEENASDFSLFIIAHGALSTLFATKFVLEEHHDLIAEVREFKDKGSVTKSSVSSVSISPATAVSVTTSPIYRIDKNICICLCKDTGLKNANKFRNAILPLLQKSAQIVTVTAQKASSYIYDKLANDISVPFIRCLHSGSYKPNCDEPYLEQPNIITGLPAAVLSWCEVFNKPGVLFCCFSDTAELNSISAEPFIKVFSCLSHNVFDPSKVMFKKQSYGSITTNLYM